MKNPTNSPVPAASVPKLWRRLWIVGFLGGLALVALGSVLPERAQSIFLYGGLALVLGTVGAQVWSSGHGLQWKGMSPAVGIALGVIAGAVPAVLTGSLFDSGVHRATMTSGAAKPQPLTGAWFRAWVTPAAAGPGNESQAPAAMQSPVTPEAASPSPSAVRLESVLSQTTDVLEQRARPILESQRNLLFAAMKSHAGSADLANIGSELQSNARELALVESSLHRIRADNPDLTKEVDAAGGDAQVLRALNDSIRVFNESLESDGGARAGIPRLRQLANQTSLANQWLEQRVATARAEIASATQ